jgi:hypothetical protein
MAPAPRLLKSAHALSFASTDEFSQHASSGHRVLLATASRAGCFRCGAILTPAEIREWTDKPAAGGASTTALCPCCGIDAVLPDTASIAIEPPLREAMQEYWFG